MNVLSLFDGMSGGQIALTELDIPIDKYYASEIDKYAMQFTIQNFPNTIQVGDVRELDINKLDKIDLLIGGSPCQSLSMAGKRKGLSTKEGIEIFDLEMYLELKENGFEFEGQSYLFWEYIRIYNDLLERGDNPKFFLENVEMGKKWESVFNDILGRKGIHINSALVSAQNRRRIYWTDIHDDIPQPEDRGILLRDILEEEVDEKYFLSDKMIECLKGRVKTEKFSPVQFSPIKFPYEQKARTINTRLFKMGDNDNYIQVDNDPICVAMRGCESACLTPKRTEYGKQIRKEYEAGIVNEQRKNIQQLEPREDGKSNCLTTVQKDNLVLVDNGNFRIRRLTPTECARLQTVPEGYTKSVEPHIGMGLLGDGWTVDVICHIFKGLKI